MKNQKTSNTSPLYQICQPIGNGELLEALIFGLADIKKALTDYLNAPNEEELHKIRIQLSELILLKQKLPENSMNTILAKKIGEL